MWVRGLFHDTRSIVSTWIRKPSFPVSVTLLIALGATLTISAFALVEAVALRKLPAPDPQRLVNVNGQASDRETAIPLGMYQQLVEGFSGVEQHFGWSDLIVQADMAESTERLTILAVTGHYYPTLGIQPKLGRLLDANDDAGQVAVLSESFWRRTFGGDPQAVGKSIRVGDQLLTIVGVADSAFRDVTRFSRPDLVVPLDVALRAENVPPGLRGRYAVQVMFRLKPGVSIPEAESALQVLWTAALTATLPSDRTMEQWRGRIGARVRVSDGSQGKSYFGSTLSQPLAFILGLTVLILLASCMSTAGLLVARSLSRTRDTAIRLALGASRWSVIRYSLVESMLLALIGVALGTATSAWTVRYAMNFLPSAAVLDFGVRIDSRSIAVALGVAIATGLLTGIAPAFKTIPANVVDAIKAGNPLASGRLGPRKVLLTAQVAFSVVLLAAAGLLGKSLRQLTRVELGFDADRIWAVQLAGRSPLGPAGPEYFSELADRVRALPGVTGAGLGSVAPLETPREFLQDVTSPGSAAATTASSVCVWPGYLGTLSIPLVQGRDLSAADRQSVIVSADLARELFGQRNALGETIRVTRRGTTTEWTIAGVAGRALFYSARQSNARLIYGPCATEWRAPQTAYGMTLVVRQSGDSAGFENGLRREVRALGKQFVLRIQPMSALLDSSFRTEKALAILAAAFGAVTLVLMCASLYALTAFTTATRSREIGTRVALGATTSRIVWLIQSETLTVAGVGLMLGLASALAGARWVSGFLYGVAATDAKTLAAVSVITFAVACAAAMWPAYRASKLQPTKALCADQ